MSIRPVFRVAVAGLDERDVRLIEIVFKHSQYNRFDFQLLPQPDPLQTDILIANPAMPSGLDALSALRALSRDVPAVNALPRGTPAAARHAITIDRLTLQLLPTLNRVVEIEGLEGRPDEPSGTVGEARDQALAPADPAVDAGSATRAVVTPSTVTPGTVTPSGATPDIATPDIVTPPLPADLAFDLVAPGPLDSGGRVAAEIAALTDLLTLPGPADARSAARGATTIPANSAPDPGASHPTPVRHRPLAPRPAATGAAGGPVASRAVIAGPAPDRRSRAAGGFSPVGPAPETSSRAVALASGLGPGRQGHGRIEPAIDDLASRIADDTAFFDASLPGIPTVATRIAIPGEDATLPVVATTDDDVFASLDLDALFAADRPPKVVRRIDEPSHDALVAALSAGTTATGRLAERAGRRLLEELAVPEIEPPPVMLPGPLPISTFPSARSWAPPDEGPRRGSHAYLLQILVADPSLAAQQQIVRALQTDGVALCCVTGASAALQQAAERQFDLVITEYSLADVSGFHLIKALRQRAGYRSTPVLLLRSRSGLLDAARARLHGDVLLLNKPLTKGELQVVVADALRRSLVLDDLETLYSEGDLQP